MKRGDRHADSLRHRLPLYFAGLDSDNRTIYGLVYQSVLTAEQGKEFLQNFSAERGLDPELCTKEELSHKKNDSPRR